MATWPHLRGPRRPPSPDNATAASLLESLPPAMLDEILCRLPIRDAARTSALSRSWRRRWMSVPYQDLHWPIGTPSLTIYEVLAHRTCTLRYRAIGTFPHIFHDVVVPPTCPVREFSFRQNFPEQDFLLSNTWLDVLARVGVRSLSLTFPHPHSHAWLPSAIFDFSYRDLTVLELEGCTVPRPRSGGFPNLTTLSLCRVGPLRGVTELEGLISSSPSLQTLRLQDLMILYEHEQWVIHAPNLQRLLISSVSDYGWQIHNLPAIEVADISFSWNYHSDSRDFVHLISVLDKAKKLNLSTPFLMGNMLEGLSRSFVNLKSLSLHLPLCHQCNILAILNLVRNAPKLEALDIEHDDYWDVAWEPDFISLYVPWADDLFSSLTSVDMKNVIWNPCEMLFIEFVLSKARQLEVFSVHESRQRMKSDEDVLADVARYRRASPGANFVISRMS